jgi:hypothetical protein
MSHASWMTRIGLLSLMSVATVATAPAVEMSDLKGHDDIFGRYAPAGDCKRKPQIVVEQSGITIDVAGKPEKLQSSVCLDYNGPRLQRHLEGDLPWLEREPGRTRSSCTSTGTTGRLEQDRTRLRVVRRSLRQPRSSRLALRRC